MAGTAVPLPGLTTRPGGDAAERGRRGEADVDAEAEGAGGSAPSRRAPSASGDGEDELSDTEVLRLAEQLERRLLDAHHAATENSVASAAAIKHGRAFTMPTAPSFAPTRPEAKRVSQRRQRIRRTAPEKSLRHKTERPEGVYATSQQPSQQPLQPHWERQAPTPAAEVKRREDAAHFYERQLRRQMSQEREERAALPLVRNYWGVHPQHGAQYSPPHGGHGGHGAHKAHGPQCDLPPERARHHGPPDHQHARDALSSQPGSGGVHIVRNKRHQLTEEQREEAVRLRERLARGE